MKSLKISLPMTRNRTLRSFSGCCVCNLFCDDFRAHASRTPPPVTASYACPNAGKAKTQRARFQVLHMMSDAIQVQSLANQHEIHTFTYSEIGFAMPDAGFVQPGRRINTETKSKSYTGRAMKFALSIRKANPPSPKLSDLSEAPA